MISKTEDSLLWILQLYSDMMIKKSFKGPSQDFYSILCDINKDFFVFQAILDDDPVAGILIIKHNDSCVYLIGWNNSLGRKVYANNFLLWNSIKTMKQEGCVFFDTGGLDEEKTPGITRFKRGLRGEEYSLVGEWLIT